jgi:hypothetical protein
MAVLLAMIAAPLAACTPATGPPGTDVQALSTTDYTRFVDNDQGPGQVFLRYPLGRAGLWSTPQGEIADSVTRGLLL